MKTKEVAEEPMQVDNAEDQTPSVLEQEAEAESETEKDTPAPTVKTKTNTEYCLICYKYMGTRREHLDDSRHAQNVERVAHGEYPKKRRAAKMSPFVHMRGMVAELQEDIGACTEPCVGVNYVIEYFHEDPSVSRVYVCYLCEKAINKSDVVGHITSATHRQQFLEAAEPELAQEISKLEDQDDRERQLKEHAAKAEEEKGRKQLHIMMYLAGHRKAQKAAFEQSPLSVLPVGVNKIRRRRKQGGEFPEHTESIGWHLTTKYEQDGNEDEAWYCCNLCGLLWMCTSSYENHMRWKPHKRRYMEKYHKDLMAQYSEEMQDDGPDKMDALTKFVHMMKEADGVKPVQVKKLIIPFPDETDESDLDWKNVRSHPMVQRNYDKLVRNEAGNYSLVFSRKELPATSEEEVEEAFSSVGKVKKVHLTRIRYGIVELGTLQEAMQALVQLGEKYRLIAPTEIRRMKLLKPMKSQQQDSTADTGQQHAGSQLQAGGWDAEKDTKLAGRKRGPPKENVASLEAKIAACKDPVIGLQYIEAHKKGPKWMFGCSLCNVDSQMTALVLDHITGHKHRYLYLQKYCGQEIGKGKLSRAKNLEMSRMVEQRDGRGRITIVGETSAAKGQSASVPPGPPSKTMRMEDSSAVSSSTTPSDKSTKGKRKRRRGSRKAKPPQTGNNIVLSRSPESAGQPSSAEGKSENEYTALSKGRFANYSGGHSPGGERGAAGKTVSGATRKRKHSANSGRRGGYSRGRGGGSSSGQGDGYSRGRGDGYSSGREDGYSTGRGNNTRRGRRGRRGKHGGGREGGGANPGKELSNRQGMGHTSRNAGGFANRGPGSGVGQRKRQNKRDVQSPSRYRYDRLQLRPMDAGPAASYYPGDSLQQLPLYEYPGERYGERDPLYIRQEYPRASQFGDSHERLYQSPGGRFVGSEQPSYGYHAGSVPYGRSSRQGPEEMDTLPPPQAPREGTHHRQMAANSERIFSLLEGLIETMKAKNKPAY